MNCPFELLISRLIDGELTGSDREAIVDHLVRCACCRELLEQFQALRDWVKGVPLPPPETGPEGALLRLAQATGLSDGRLKRIWLTMEKWIRRPVNAFRMALTAGVIVTVVLSLEPRLCDRATQYLHRGFTRFLSHVVAESPAARLPNGS